MTGPAGPSLAAAIAALAESFCRAEAAAAPRPLVSAERPAFSVAEAYAVQLAATCRKQAAGRRRLGYKVGFASRGIQEAFGVHEPIFGHLIEGAVYRDGATIPRRAFIHPGVEPELLFVMSRRLRGPGVTAEQVLAATQRVAPAFELVDCRFPTWKFSVADCIADNGCNAGAVLGGGEEAGLGLDLGELEMALEKNGVEVGRARGAAILGHPANSVAWLVNKLAEFDRALEAGECVLCGSFTTTYMAEAGDRFEAAYSGLGRLAARFM